MGVDAQYLRDINAVVTPVETPIGSGRNSPVANVRGVVLNVNPAGPAALGKQPPQVPERRCMTLPKAPSFRVQLIALMGIILIGTVAWLLVPSSTSSMRRRMPTDGDDAAARAPSKRVCSFDHGNPVTTYCDDQATLDYIHAMEQSGLKADGYPVVKSSNPNEVESTGTIEDPTPATQREPPLKKAPSAASEAPSKAASKAPSKAPHTTPGRLASVAPKSKTKPFNYRLFKLLCSVNNYSKAVEKEQLISEASIASFRIEMKTLESELDLDQWSESQAARRTNIQDMLESLDSQLKGAG